MAISKAQLYRILREHYLDGVSQREIAAKENLSTATVSRLIKEARDEGYVKISLQLPDNSVPELEEAIQKTFAVPQVFVVPAERGAQEYIEREITQVFEDYLNSILRNGDVIGLSWGRTLSAVAKAMQGGVHKDITFVSMSGGVSAEISDFGVEQTTRAFAEVYGARGYAFPLPVYLEDSKLAKALTGDRQFREVFDLIQQARIAIFSVGPMSTDSLLYDAGYLSYQGIRELRNAGIVGDICARPLKEDGSYDESETYNRSVGITLKELKKKEHKLCIVIDTDKAEALAGALRGAYVDALFVDELTARALLKIQN